MPCVGSKKRQFLGDAFGMGYELIYTICNREKVVLIGYPKQNGTQKKGRFSSKDFKEDCFLTVALLRFDSDFAYFWEASI